MAKAAGSGYYSTNVSHHGTTPPKQSFPKDANVKVSRLNAGGDKNWRGKRGGVAKGSTSKEMY